MNSTFWVNKIMRTMYTDSKDTFYIGLSSTLPADDGSNLKEPSSASYARVAVNGFTSPVDGTVYIPETITFPKSTEVWFPSNAKAAYWVLFDGSGNLLSAGELNEPKTIESSTVLHFDANTVGITLTDYNPGIG